MSELHDMLVTQRCKHYASAARSVAELLTAAAATALTAAELAEDPNVDALNLAALAGKLVKDIHDQNLMAMLSIMITDSAEAALNSPQP